MVADLYVPGDLVLVLDYELMLLPMLLRKRFPDVVCGFFLHCPFPSSEFYRMLPVRTELLQGILGADLVSCNHFDYIRHFVNSCTRLLGLDCFPSRVDHNGRCVSPKSPTPSQGACLLLTPVPVFLALLCHH